MQEISVMANFIMSTLKNLVSREINMSNTGKGLEEEEVELLPPYLTEEIYTKIILRTSAESLFKSVRYVCKPWYKLINNHPDIPLNRLLRSKPPCLILQTRDHSSLRYIESGISRKEACELHAYPTYTTHFIKMGMEGIEEQYDITPPFNELCIRACCNGIILASPEGIKRDATMLHVFNPLTNQFVILPPYLGSDFNPYPQLIFLPSTREYKVIVGIYRGESETQYDIQILTLSLDGGNTSDLKWKLIEAPNRLLRFPPLAINGIFYWAGDGIVSFDATAEKFHITPNPFLEPKKYGEFIDMYGHLAFVCISDPSLTSGDSKLHVWILQDIYSGEWTKQYSVTLHSDFMKPGCFYSITHVLSFGNGEVIMIRKRFEKTLWAYNVKTNQWWKLQTNLTEDDHIEFHGFHVDNILELESIFASE